MEAAAAVVLVVEEEESVAVELVVLGVTAAAGDAAEAGDAARVKIVTMNITESIPSGTLLEI